MKFMEVDSAGYVHHICDDPTVTIVPLVNRISHGDKSGKPLVDSVGKLLSYHGNAWLPPLPISDADFAQLTKDGLCGTTDKGTSWHYKYDLKARSFTKAPVL